MGSTNEKNGDKKLTGYQYKVLKIEKLEKELKEKQARIIDQENEIRKLERALEKTQDENDEMAFKRMIKTVKKVNRWN